MQNSRSKELLNKVYDHLDSIDVSVLSMNELKDFLEVVQKGQFLESFGQMPTYALGGFNAPRFGNAGSGNCTGGNETTTGK